MPHDLESAIHEALHAIPTPAVLEAIFARFELQRRRRLARMRADVTLLEASLERIGPEDVQHDPRCECGWKCALEKAAPRVELHETFDNVDAVLAGFEKTRAKGRER